MAESAISYQLIMISYDDKCVSTIKVIMFSLIASVPLKEVLDQELARIFQKTLSLCSIENDRFEHCRVLMMHPNAARA